MQKGSCCPKGSWPLLQSDYHSTGEKIQVAKTSCYHIGAGKRVIVMVSDIFGATSGRHQAIADTFASFGYNVYLPEILTSPYSGPMSSKMMDCIKHQDYNKMKERFLGLTKYLEDKEYHRFFIIGFCWGVWFSFKMASDVNNILAIAGMHPALGLENSFGGDVNFLTKQLKCPAYLYPAGNDPENIKPDGQVVKIMEEKFGGAICGSHQFPDMVHGWTARGDISDPKVKRDVQKVMEMCKQYFEQFYL